MKRLLYLLILTTANIILNGQVHCFNNINDNRITRDSVLSLIEDYEVKNQGHFLTAVIVHTEAKEDSIIHRIIFEKHRLDTSTQKIENWKYLDLIGERLDVSTIDQLDTNYKFIPNRPTLINFWFTACIPCRDEIPFLNSVQKEFQDQLNFIAVTFEPNESVNKFLRSLDFRFNHYVNGQNLTNELGIEAYPVTFLLDENSQIIRVFLPFKQEDRANSPKSWSSTELIKELKKVTTANNN